MRKIMFVGRTGAGKTTLTQALRGENISYYKTQYIYNDDFIIDTPGEYAENTDLARALIIFSHEADIVGLLINATEPYCLYSPNIAPLGTREVIGIITHINDEDANVELAKIWMDNIGCKKIFLVDSVTGEGVDKILDYLKQPNDGVPWMEKYAKQVQGKV